jgi:flagellar export protein FliJ
MTVKRQSALELLIGLRRRERDQVAGVAAQAQRDAETASSTLRMLDTYRADYESRSPKLSQTATSTLSIQVHEAFVGKLGRAIGEQDALVTHLNERSSQQRAALTDRQQRLRALEMLALKRELEQRKRLAALEQKQTDEFAMQVYARANRPGAHHD